MSDAFFLQETPDFWIVNLSQAVMGATNSRDGPGESPTHGVEQPAGYQLRQSGSSRVSYGNVQR